LAFYAEDFHVAVLAPELLECRGFEFERWRLKFEAHEISKIMASGSDKYKAHNKAVKSGKKQQNKGGGKKGGSSNGPKKPDLSSVPF